MGLKDMKYSTSRMDYFKYIYGALAPFLKLENS